MRIMRMTGIGVVALAAGLLAASGSAGQTGHVAAPAPGSEACRSFGAHVRDEVETTSRPGGDPFCRAGHSNGLSGQRLGATCAFPLRRQWWFRS